MKRFIEANYPTGIEDIPNTKIAERMRKAMKGENRPSYLNVYIENDNVPAKKTLTNRLSYLKKEGFIA